jgi:CRISPR/Cas system CSM-associated protein Csm3 (group 7 of RAMP superfamily)
MNPYDFARIDWSRAPARCTPIWHHQLTSREGERLYSGSLDVEVYAETPLIILGPRGAPGDGLPEQSMRNKQGNFIIPGSSLKGMIRSVVETLGNGCLTLFDGEYDHVNYRSKVPGPFQRCENNSRLCIACRIFGMLKEGNNEQDRERAGVFLGKVNIGDAVASKIYEHKQVSIDGLMGPRPHHAAFYLDESGQRISGRKFYFHHMEIASPRNKSRRLSIQPLDYGTQFSFRVDFTALEEDEFGALLFAIALEENMRHKIGYGKPLGLGSVRLKPVKVTLIDYAARYTSAAGRGKVEKQGDDLWYDVFYVHMDDFLEHHVVSMALDDLRRIWHWPPDPKVSYHYPDHAWFTTPGNSTKRIAQTP